jgi:hypothetical protein
MATNQGRNKQAQQQIDHVLSKAAGDAAFRQQLLSDPKGTLGRELGAQIPANIKILVLEDSADRVHLVLPPAQTTGRLSDAELESVAGGECAQWGGNSWSTW